MKLIFNTIFFFLIFNLKAFAVEFTGNFQQGSFILGKTEKTSKVFIDNRQVRLSKEGFFAFGLGRDRKNNVIIKIINKGKEKYMKKSIQKSL